MVFIARFVMFVFETRYIESLHGKLLSFVFGVAIKGNEIKHLAHTGADTVAVVAFELGGGEVGGGMSHHVIVDKMVISR